jgi:hypothetical protein
VKMTSLTLKIFGIRARLVIQCLLRMCGPKKRFRSFEQIFFVDALKF